MGWEMVFNFNLLSIKWEGWSKWLEVASFDLPSTYGALLFVGVVEKEFEWDLLYIKLIWRWIAWRTE